MKDTNQMTVTHVADSLKNHQLKSIDLVNELFERIAQVNPGLNAIVTLDDPGARLHAQSADEILYKGEETGPLLGVPVTIKDSFETAGIRTVSGYPPFANRIPAVDAPPVARLRQAGAIIIGKTNLPTLASGIQSNNPVFGRSNNPWDLSRTPGGSSGGAAAAIAAQLSYLELGSDIGGSIRIPAHFCGVYGLKCTGGRISGKGHLSSPVPLTVPKGWEALLQLASMGPIARSVADLRLALPILAEPGTPGLEPQPVKALADLRIAWTDDFGGAPLDEESRRLMGVFAGKLVQAGAKVEHVSGAGFDYEEAWFIAGACLGTINTLFQKKPVQHIRRLAGPLLALTGRHALQRGLSAGITLKHATVADMLKKRAALIEQVESFLDRWDAWICPVFPTPAFPHCKPSAPIAVDGKPISQLLANLLHNILFNVTGHPAVALPIGLAKGGFNGQGLPIGVQVLGKRWQEHTLLNTAEQISSAAGPGELLPIL